MAVEWNQHMVADGIVRADVGVMIHVDWPKDEILVVSCDRLNVAPSIGLDCDFLVLFAGQGPSLPPR